MSRSMDYQIEELSSFMQRQIDKLADRIERESTATNKVVRLPGRDYGPEIKDHEERIDMLEQLVVRQARLIGALTKSIAELSEMLEPCEA